MKIGTTVEFNRRNGEVARGKVAGAPVNHGKGDWIDVNIGDKKKPVIMRVRPSQLRKI